MKTIRILATVFSAIACALAAGALWAGEQPLRFVHALQENGYGDMAVEYLKILDKQPDLPSEVRDVWDLEMSNSLKAAVGRAFDANEAETLLQESQRHLAAFINEKPNHPEAMAAMASLGDFLVDRAMESLRAAKAVERTDAEQCEKLLAKTRASLGDARDKFQQGEKHFQTQLEDLPPEKLSTKKREARRRAETELYKTQLRLALIDYYLAQTYSERKSEVRIDLLKSAAQAFDAVFQRNRNNEIGVRAHMWHGKTAEELGDSQLAMDIYDEVMAFAPSSTEKGPATDADPLFAQVEHFRLMILAKKKYNQFYADATLWLKENPRLMQTEGYQGILLDVVRAKLAKAEQATASEKAKLMAEARKMVAEGAKVNSPYQQDFFKLRQEVLKIPGGESQADTFAEIVAIGDAAAAASDWKQAMDSYTKALALAEKTKAQKTGAVAAVRGAIDRVQLMIARDLFNKGKFDDCIAAVKTIVYDDQHVLKRESPTAAQASVLAVLAALNLYAQAQQSNQPAEALEKALTKMTKLAEFTEKTWSDKPEADDARMARGQAKLVVGQVPEAIEIFERVNPKSERYAAAMYWAGQNYWRMYLLEKLKGDDKADKNKMAANRVKAQQRLATSLEAFRKQREPGKAMPRFMPEAQLLMAEMYNEGDQPKEAAALYQPLVDAAGAETQQNFDDDTIRVYLGAVRAYCTLGDLDKAGLVSAQLIERGPDRPQANEALVYFAKLLNVERQKAEGQVTELEGTAKLDDLKAARDRLASVQGLLGRTLVKLSQRSQLNLSHMMFIGEALNSIGMTDQASEQFNKILDRTRSDPAFAKLAQGAMSRLRSGLLKALRKQKKYEEALKQVNQLIKDNPRALEPLMEKGYILEALAEKDPAKFDEAVKHWADLRNRLQGLPPKSRPDEYYEVMYNVAKCLVREAEKSKDKTVVFDRANKAEKVLKAALVLSPKLNGPDTVAKCKVLVDKAIALQGRSPEKKTEKK